MAEVTVSLEKVRSNFIIDTQGLAFGTLTVDEGAIPEELRRGTAKRLLASSVLYCFIGSFGEALAARGAEAEKIWGSATVTTGQDDLGRIRIIGMSLSITIRIGRQHKEIYEKVWKIMRKGCQISASLESAFPISYEAVPEWI